MVQAAEKADFRERVVAQQYLQHTCKKQSLSCLLTLFTTDKLHSDAQELQKSVKLLFWHLLSKVMIAYISRTLPYTCPL